MTHVRRTADVNDALDQSNRGWRHVRLDLATSLDLTARERGSIRAETG
jgi:hypothetical protein